MYNTYLYYGVDGFKNDEMKNIGTYENDFRTQDTISYPSNMGVIRYPFQHQISSRLILGGIALQGVLWSFVSPYRTTHTFSHLKVYSAVMTKFLRKPMDYPILIPMDFIL